VADAEHMPERLVARYLAPYVGADGVSHLLALARALRSTDVEELDLASVVAPALVVWGEADPWLPTDLPDRLVAALPRARLVRLPGVGRLVPEEAPEELVRLILDFVGAERAGGRRPEGSLV
jgi:pimeloyl-ACP methyl ester carboxylesterase